LSETFENLEETPVETTPVDPGSTIPRSPYELVVVAAQEARRLNDRWRRAATDRTDKVTKTAVDRVLAGHVHFITEDTPGI
jgi:DNA-directed RNA polymerase subunit K/omega